MQYCSSCQNNNYVSQINQYQGQTYSSKATDYDVQSNIANYGPYNCQLASQPQLDFSVQNQAIAKAAS